MQYEQSASPIVNGSQGTDEEQNQDAYTIVIENEGLRRGFTLIPNEILKDTSISFGARLTFTLLLSYAWQKGSCFPGQDTLAGDLGVSRKSVNSYLRELKKHQYISWTRRGLGKTNIYYILDRARRKDCAVSAKKSEPCKPTHTGNGPDVTVGLHQDVTSTTQQNVTAALHKTDTEEEYSEQQQAVAQKLQDLKIDAKRIQKFFRRHSSSYLMEKINLLEWKQRKQSKGQPIEDPAAWLVRAVEDDYQPPAGYKTRQEQKQKRHEQTLKLEEWHKKLAEQERQEQTKKSIEHNKSLKKLMKNYGTSANEKRLWARVLRALERQTGKATYQFSFLESHLLSVQDGVAVVGVPNMLVKRRIDREFAPIVVQTLMKTEPNIGANKLRTVAVG